MTVLRIDVQRIKPAVLKEVHEELNSRGIPIGNNLLKPGPHQALVLWAYAYVLGRRSDPNLTWDDAGEIDVEVVGVPVPPTNAGG